MAEPVQLKRSLSLTMVTFYGIGTILGAGIYVLIGEVAVTAGIFAPVSFLVASFLALFTAIAYAELSSRFPKSAGEAVYVQEGFQRRHLSILTGLAVVLIGIISSATISKGFVGYLHVFIQMPDWVVITMLVLTLGVIAIWGISESVIFATILTLLEIGGLLIVLWVALPSFVFLPERLPDLIPPMNYSIWNGILLGSFLAFYAFIGFEDMVNVAEEVKEPSKTLPIAIILALVITTALYFLVSLSAVLVLPVEKLAGSKAPLAVLYEHATGSRPVVISLISMFAVVNGALIQIIMAARILYGMSRQGWLPTVFSDLNPLTRTPLKSTLFVTMAILILALWLPLVTLAKVTSLVTLMIFAIVNLSLWVIKYRQPAPEGVRTFPLWIPVTGFFVTIVFILLQLLTGQIFT